MSGVQFELSRSHGHAEKQRGSSAATLTKKRVTTNILYFGQNKRYTFCVQDISSSKLFVHLNMNNNGGKETYLLFVTRQSQLIPHAAAVILVTSTLTDKDQTVKRKAQFYFSVKLIQLLC